MPSDALLSPVCASMVDNESQMMAPGERTRVKMRPRRFLIALITVVFGLVLVSGSAGAQVPGQPTFDVAKLPGLKTAVNRVYTGDIAALYLGPGGGQGGSGFFSVSATAAKFDGNAHAAAALRALEGQYSGSNESAAAFHLKPVKIDRIGDGSFAYTGATKMGKLDGTLGIVVARKGRYIVTAAGFAMGIDPVPPMTDLVRAMAGRKEGGVVEKTADGLHTGGLWSLLPLDQSLPDGVKANMDIQVYPAPKT